MEYQIVRVSNGLVMLQREDDLDWVISEELSEYLVPISITMGFKTKADKESRADIIREQSVDKATQVLTTLMRFVDGGQIELAKILATSGSSYYSDISPIGLYASENTDGELIDDSDDWSEDYAVVVFKYIAQVYDVCCCSHLFSEELYRAEAILEYYRNELVKYIKRNPDILKEHPDGHTDYAQWLHGLVK